ncbi:MAG: hypothetical protein H0X24_02115 [Ktedonobacterales bacterium]|nr:hypothetical protein [Ktedonobacterales bacterium]
MHEQEAAFQEFEVGRAVALDLADAREVISLDITATTTLIALAQHRLVADRLTTDLTQRLPCIVEEQIPFFARERYFRLWENAVAHGDAEATRQYHVIATALLERDLPRDLSLYPNRGLCQRGVVP